jgi:hypothetical protein
MSSSATDFSSATDLKGQMRGGKRKGGKGTSMKAFTLVIVIIYGTLASFLLSICKAASLADARMRRFHNRS